MQTSIPGREHAAAPSNPALFRYQSGVNPVPNVTSANALPTRLAARRPRDTSTGLARALGWFSIGLGVVQLMAPRQIARAVGTGDHPVLLRALGTREIASGIGILSRPQPGPWLWARVAGDAMDLALLGMAAASHGKSSASRRRLSYAAAAVAGVTALDVLSGMWQSRQSRAAEAGLVAGEVDVEKSISINRSPGECYRFWRDFQNFPHFMKHLEDVQLLSDTRSHWKAKGPAGSSIEWDAELSVDHPNELLAWHSVGDTDVPNAGTVRFERAPGGRGTIVRVELQYKPPGGEAGALIAKLFGEEPALQIDQDLRRFKQLVETGEIPTTVGQPSGPRSLISRILFRKGEPG